MSFLILSNTTPDLNPNRHNNLSKMATFAGLFRRTTRSSKPDECEPLPEPRPLPSLPDFASLGITDSASIARE